MKWLHFKLQNNIKQYKTNVHDLGLPTFPNKIQLYTKK